MFDLTERDGKIVPGGDRVVIPYKVSIGVQFLTVFLGPSLPDTEFRVIEICQPH